jgi:hypothetical protein
MDYCCRRKTLQLDEHPENEVIVIWTDDAVTNPTGSNKKGSYAA